MQISRAARLRTYRPRCLEAHGPLRNNFTTTRSSPMADMQQSHLGTIKIRIRYLAIVLVSGYWQNLQPLSIQWRVNISRPRRRNTGSRRKKMGPLYQVTAQWRSRSTTEEAQLVVYIGNPSVANSSFCRGHLWAIPYMSTTIDRAPAGRPS